MVAFAPRASWRCLSLDLERGRMQASARGGDPVLQFSDHGCFDVSFPSCALQFNLAPEQLIGEGIKAAGVSAADTYVPVRANAPRFQALKAVGHLGGIRSALDRVGHGGEENIGIGVLHVLNRGLDIL